MDALGTALLPTRSRQPQLPAPRTSPRRLSDELCASCSGSVFTVRVHPRPEVQGWSQRRDAERPVRHLRGPGDDARPLQRSPLKLQLSRFSSSWDMSELRFGFPLKHVRLQLDGGGRRGGDMTSVIFLWSYLSPPEGGSSLTSVIWVLSCL